MSALESMIASSGEAPIHSALDFTLPAPSTAVTDRKQHCRAYPTSASSLSISGTRTVRLRLGGDDFIDPASLRVQMTISNLDGTATKLLKPVCGPWGMWQQVYCRSGGVEIDNIPYYNRWHQQYGWNHLTMAEQFGEVGITGLHSSNPGVMRPLVGTIAGTKSFTCMHKLHLSLLSSNKLLPTRYAPLEIELSLISTASDWLDLADANTTTSNFSISDIQLLYDAYTLDEAVQNSFYSALLKGQVLSIPVLNAYQIVQALPTGATTYSFSAVRAFRRLLQIWLTFRGAGPRSSQFISPGDLPGGDVTNSALENTAVPQVRLSIGPHNWPQPQPVTTSAEHFYQFQKALGHVPNMNRWIFENDAFTMVFDIKKLPSDITSALSTRSGDLVRVDLTSMNGTASECWLTMISFGVCAIRESGVTLLS